MLHWLCLRQEAKVVAVGFSELDKVRAERFRRLQLHVCQSQAGKRAAGNRGWREKLARCILDSIGKYMITMNSSKSISALPSESARAKIPSICIVHMYLNQTLSLNKAIRVSRSTFWVHVHRYKSRRHM